MPSASVRCLVGAECTDGVLKRRIFAISAVLCSAPILQSGRLSSYATLATIQQAIL